MTYAQSLLVLGRALGNEQRQVNATDNLSFNAGSHQIKGGVDYRLLLPLFTSGDRDVYVYTGVPTVVSNTGSTFERFFTGSVRGYIPGFSSYIQDTWRVSDRLTLTYGLRWEINGAPHNQEPNNGNYVPLLGDLSNPSTLTAGPAGSPLWHTHYWNFAPRLGVAYRLRQMPGWETVVRAGSGLFYDLGYGGFLGNLEQAYPNLLSATVSNVAFPVNPASAALPVVNLTNPPPGQRFVDFPGDFALPRTWEWNFTIEQEIAGNQTISIGYVGATGRKLLYQSVYQNLGPQNYLVTLTDNEGESDYNSLQVQYVRRLRHGLSASAAFTWSHSIDNVSIDTPQASTPGTTFLAANTNRGPSDFDLRETVNGAVSWEVPRVSSSAFMQHLTSNWGIDGILTARSALPINIVSTQNLGYGSFNYRPDLVPGVPVYVNNPNVAGGVQINPGAFVIVKGRQGDLGRNAVRGFDMFQTDLALRRRFRISEKFGLQFRADVFNIFNHPNFASPVSTLTTGTFGTSTAMLNSGVGGVSTGQLGLASVFQSGGPRSIQLSLKFVF